MKLIRNGTFETNSSSCHTITVVHTGVYEGVTPSPDGVIYLEPGDFGRSQQLYTDARSKMTYVLRDITDCEDNWKDESKFERFKRVVCAHTGATDIVLMRSKDDYHPYGYIDHQSQGCTAKLFESDEMLKNFIFLSNSLLRTADDGDCDCSENSDCPYNCC